jgi:hypothetical protein
MFGIVAALQWLGRAGGSTRAERHSELPGDDLVFRPMFTTNHAITIDAPPEAVWPWLVQMGWHRGGWYTSRWVDELLFPDNDPAADTIEPALQRLHVGDLVPDGAPETECYFVVRELEANRFLVLHSQSHLPPGFRDRYDAWIDWSWVFVLTEPTPGTTRFLFRSRARIGPWWLSVLYRLLLVPADFVMSRQMLHGVRRRAEGGLPSGDGHRRGGSNTRVAGASRAPTLPVPAAARAGCCADRDVGVGHLRDRQAHVPG